MNNSVTAPSSHDSAISLRPAVMDDYETIYELCELRFGKGYLKRSEYESWLEYPDFFTVALYNGEIAGFAYLMPEDAEHLADSMRIDVDGINSYSEGKPVMHYRSAALFLEYEGFGIMYRLLHTGLLTAKNHGYGAVYAPAWKFNNIIPMKRLMDLLGFEELCIRKMLWYDQVDYRCVVCDGRCRCDAVIYRKKLTGEI